MAEGTAALGTPRRIAEKAAFGRMVDGGGPGMSGRDGVSGLEYTAEVPPPVRGDGSTSPTRPAFAGRTVSHHPSPLRIRLRRARRGLILQSDSGRCHRYFRWFSGHLRSGGMTLRRRPGSRCDRRRNPIVAGDRRGAQHTLAAWRLSPDTAANGTQPPVMMPGQVQEGRPVPARPRRGGDRRASRRPPARGQAALRLIRLSARRVSLASVAFSSSSVCCRMAAQSARPSSFAQATSVP